MTRYWLALALACTAAPSLAQSGAQEQRRIVLQGVDWFRADVEGRLKAPQPKLEALRAQLAACDQRACAAAWGKAFFPEANRLAKRAPESGGMVRRMESDYQILLSYLSPQTQALDRMATTVKAKGKRLDPETLARAFDRAGESSPIVYVAGAVRAAPLPVQHQAAAVEQKKKQSLSPAPHLSRKRNLPKEHKAAPVPEAKKLLEQASPAEWSEALVRAYFLPAKQPKPIEVHYRFGADGEIVSLAVPGHDYEETRQFEGGLVRSRQVRRGEERAEIVMNYDARGRYKSREIRGNPLALLPFSAPVVDFVLDWQISREPKLKLEEDTRPKLFHSPFWDGRWNGLSRGYTDKDAPETWTKHPILNVKLPHEGIDMPMPEGTAVYPARRGKVVAVGWESGYGLRVKVQHYRHNRPDGTPDAVTLYGHLSATSVKKGQWVTPGLSVLGKVGSTGLSTGPHLHFEVHEDGRPVDPAEKLSPTLPAKTPRTVVAPTVAMKR